MKERRGKKEKNWKNSHIVDAKINGIGQPEFEVIYRLVMVVLIIYILKQTI